MCDSTADNQLHYNTAGGHWVSCEMCGQWYEYGSWHYCPGINPQPSIWTTTTGTSQVPHTCPACNGDGWRESFKKETKTTITYTKQTCHACKGEGVLWK